MGDGGEESMLSDGSPFTKEEETSEGGRKEKHLVCHRVVGPLSSQEFLHPLGFIPHSVVVPLGASGHICRLLSTSLFSEGWGV